MPRSVKIVFVVIIILSILAIGPAMPSNNLIYTTGEREGFYKMSIVNIKDYGAKGDGATDDTQAIQNAVKAGGTIYFPLPSDHYYVTDTITVPNSSKGVHLLFAGGNVPAGNGIVQIDDSFPANKPIFQLARGSIVENLTIYHKGVNKYTGIGIQIGNSSDDSPQAINIKNCSFYKLDTAIVYGGGAYYNAIETCQFMECNNAIKFDLTQRKYLGSLSVRDSHFWHNRESGVYAASTVKGTCNQVEFSNCTFEQNKFHIKSEAGTISFNKCYFGDGCIYHVYLNGGTVIIDGHSTENLFGAGSKDFIVADIDAPSYGVYALAGKLKLKDLKLSRNIYTENGIIYEKKYKGTDLYAENALIECENVKYEGYYAPKFTYNKNNRCEEIPNYIINGMFNRDNILETTLVKGIFNLSVLGENGFGGKEVRFTASTASFAAVEFYYYAPHLVGKIAYLGAFIGPVSTTKNLVPAFYPAEGEYENKVDWDVYPKYGNVVLDYAFNLMPMMGEPGFYSSFFAPVLIKKPFGKIKFRVFNPAAIGAYIDIAGVFLTDEIHAGKLARFNEVSKIILGENAPTNGIFNKGDEVKNINFTEQGTAGNKYIIDSWVCIADGAPGTWVEKKYLTGN